LQQEGNDYHYYYHYYQFLLSSLSFRFLGGIMVRLLDFWSSGLGLDSLLGHYQVTTLGKYFTAMCFCH